MRPTKDPVMTKAKSYNHPREALMTALAHVIEAAPSKERTQLSEALEQYAYAFPHQYRKMDRGGTLISSVLCTIEESADCRILRDNADLPDQEALD
jgi:hypothetical protein